MNRRDHAGLGFLIIVVMILTFVGHERRISLFVLLTFFVSGNRRGHLMSSNTGRIMRKSAARARRYSPLCVPVVTQLVTDPGRTGSSKVSTTVMTARAAEVLVLADVLLMYPCVHEPACPPVARCCPLVFEPLLEEGLRNGSNSYQISGE